MSEQPPMTTTFDRSKAAKLFIDQYYAKLMERIQQRQERFAMKPSLSEISFSLISCVSLTLEKIEI
jgi:hypothetical protein